MGPSTLSVYAEDEPVIYLLTFSKIHNCCSHMNIFNFEFEYSLLFLKLMLKIIKGYLHIYPFGRVLLKNLRHFFQDFKQLPVNSVAHHCIFL